jgi:3-isopropylmalate/(R)-2-methylmalate dehydratase small subunit
MSGITEIEGVAAPIMLDNIDTDMLCPAQFLHTIDKVGLGKCLFYEFRHKADGSLEEDFILNKPAYQNASILIAGKNFGSGSSREHAAWAVKGFGIRCVIARDFADIFRINAQKNGILLISLDQEIVEALARDAERGANARFTINLLEQKIRRPDGDEVPFTIDPFQREYLLKGMTDVDELGKLAGTIIEYETRQKAAEPWLWANLQAVPLA